MPDSAPTTGAVRIGTERRAPYLNGLTKGGTTRLSSWGDVQGRSGRILIADGDARTRDAVRSVFARTGFETVDARSGLEALDIAQDERPALVLLEVQLPGVSGYEVCHELREQYGSELPIIFLSATRTDASDRVAGLLIGADDYVVKPFDSDELLARARRLISRGNGRFNGASPSPNGVDALTAREREVLGLLAAGILQDEISTTLFISPKTVATHIQRILAKLGVHSRAEAVAVAHRSSLVADVDGHEMSVAPDDAAA